VPAVPAAEPALCPKIREATLHASDRMTARRTRVQVKVKQTGPKSFVHEAAEGFHPAFTNVQTGDAFGTTSLAFKDRMMSQIATVFDDTGEYKSDQGVNMALAVLDGAKPENEVEAMLLAQMIVSHDAAMNCLAQVGKGFINQTDVFGGLAIKLMRTYTAQVEALAKLRRKGEQTVKVVHVYPGGQAVVGDVHHHGAEGGADQQTEDQPDGTGQSAERAALPRSDAVGHGVPLPRDAERAMSPARRPVSRRAEG